MEERLEINIGDLQDCFLEQICLHLVDFDHTVDLSHEPEAGKETNCACEEEKAENHDRGVAKVEEC